MTYRVNIALLVLIILLAACKQRSDYATLKGDANESPKDEGPENMVWIPAGEFTMGTNDPESYSRESPAHRVRVDGFWMDKTEVTNKDFGEFVKATGYVTTAEKKPEWEQLKKQLPPGTPRPHDSVFQAGSLVFTPPSGVVMLNDYSQWWKWVAGASWRHPKGPGSNLEGRWNHPVIHISYDDAVAYCQWAGKRLPTEAEWEYASRAGHDGKRYSWGEEFTPQGRYMANTFQGSFPNKDTGEDGFSDTSPVGRFPANDFGLYDMIGNCWEWVSDYYNIDYYSLVAKNGIVNNPKGALTSYDPEDPFAEKHVTRGGSFLCAENYCVNYRPSARQGSAFDSGMSHIGFRCVMTADMWNKEQRASR